MPTLHAAIEWLRPVLADGPRFAYAVEVEAHAAGHESAQLAGARRALRVVVDLVERDGWSRARWALPDRTMPTVPTELAPPPAPKPVAVHYPALPPPAAPRRGASNRIRVELGTSNPAAALERALRDFSPVLSASKSEVRRRVAFVAPSAARKLKSERARRRRAQGVAKAARRAAYRPASDD
jgi:hypothetical protein